MSVSASDLFNVNGMVFVITGGGSGLGAMMAQALDVNGASKVFILGRRQASLEKTAKEAINGSIIPVNCDVTSRESLTAAVAEVQRQTPFVNAVVANTGIAGPSTAVLPFRGGRPSNIGEIREFLWGISNKDNNEVSNVNTIGAFDTFVAFLELLDAGNKHPDSIGSKGFIQSQFVTLSSIAAYMRSNIVGHPYAFSKAAIVHLTKMMATEFAPYKIRANCIAPGIFPTEATEGVFIPEGAPVHIPGNLPADINVSQRTGSAEDIAGAILYLVSRAGAFVNGNVVLSDGGAVAISQSTY